MAQTVDNAPVGDLRLDLYLGDWFEIARMDHSFERGISHAKASYTLLGDGSIMVVNSGLRNNRMKVSKGKAKLTDTAGLLRVSFFGPFYSDYRVMMIGEDYQYALVGSKKDKYLWILSRKPEMDDIDLCNVLCEARSRGYRTDELLWVEHGPMN